MTLFSDNLGNLKPAELTLPTNQQEYNDKEKSLEEKWLGALRLKISDKSQVDDQEDHMLKTYKEYKEKLDQEERMEFDK